MCARSQLSIDDMAFMGHGRFTGAGREVMAVIWGFFDGSYEREEKPSVIAVCGFIAPKEYWIRLTERWALAILNPELPSVLRRFHAFDCVHGIEEFASWNLADRLALWGDLVGILIDSELAAVGSVLICEHFYALSDAMQKRLRNPYHLPVEMCIQSTLTKVRTELPEEHVGLFFDNENRPIADESHIRYGLYSQDPNWNSNLAGFAQVSSYDAVPLQAADLLAYGSFRWHKKAFYPDTPDLDFPIMPAFGRLLANVEACGVVYEEKALAALTSQITEREGIR